MLMEEKFVDEWSLSKNDYERKLVKAKINDYFYEHADEGKFSKNLTYAIAIHNKLYKFLDDDIISGDMQTYYSDKILQEVGELTGEYW